MSGYTTLEGSELRRLEQCEAELLEHRMAISELRAKMAEFEARIEILEQKSRQAWASKNSF